jgi:adenylate cyclase
MADTAGAGQGFFGRLFQKKEKARGTGRVSRFRRAFSNDRILGIGILLLAMYARYEDPLPMEMFRLKVFDYYQQLKPRPLIPNSPAVIIDLDEASLTEVGQWPWPRTQVGDLIQKLFAKGVAVVGFDVFFVEMDRMSGPLVAQNLPGIDEETKQKLAQLKSNDEVMAEVIRANKRVVLGQAVGFEADEAGLKREPPISTVGELTATAGARQPREWVPPARALIRNNPVLESAAVSPKINRNDWGGIGMVSLQPEPDGIVRRVPAFTRFSYPGVGADAKPREGLIPALSVEMLRVAFQRPSIVARSDLFGISQVRITPQLDISTDERGLMWPYFSKMDKDKYVSAKDVLNGSVPAEKLRGKLAIIGTSAAGLLDIKTIPTERTIPGVEVHTQLIESILTKSYLDRRVNIQGMTLPLNMDAAEFMLAATGGLLMIILVPWVGARWTLIVFAAIAGAAAWTSWYLFTEYRVLFDPVFPVGLIFALYALLTYTNYAREEKQQRETRSAFAKYMSPAVVARVVEDPTLLTLGGDKRNMTILFCDVRGFTGISEQFDAEGLTVVINKLLTPLTNVILTNQGTVDKYMGDCIMAFWNAPLDVPNHPKMGCISALQMMQAMGPLNDRLDAEAREAGRTHLPLKVGIGLNTGDAVVGNMGTAQRMDYSVLGDTVNTASRLEGQSKTYGVDIVIGPNTAERVPEMAVIELDLLQVKGKTVGLQVFALMGDETVAQKPAFQEYLQVHNAMLKAYRSQQWDLAEELLKECRVKGAEFKLDKLCDLYEARIEAYRAEPPGPDWNGVFVATSK